MLYCYLLIVLGENPYGRVIHTLKDFLIRFKTKKASYFNCFYTETQLLKQKTFEMFQFTGQNTLDKKLWFYIEG